MIIVCNGVIAELCATTVLRQHDITSSDGFHRRRPGGKDPHIYLLLLTDLPDDCYHELRLLPGVSLQRRNGQNWYSQMPGNYAVAVSH
ncbi:MAG: hypothetical protein AAGF95_25235 [Chloroflexota bacterium]